DDGGRSRADVAPEDDPARRALDGPRAADRRGNLRDRARAEREGEGLLPARRAEHLHGAALREIRLHPRERPRGARRRRREPARKRGCEGVLSRRRRGGPPLVQEREALQAAQAVAGINKRRPEVPAEGRPRRMTRMESWEPSSFE